MTAEADGLEAEVHQAVAARHCRRPLAVVMEEVAELLRYLHHFRRWEAEEIRMVVEAALKAEAGASPVRRTRAHSLPEERSLDNRMADRGKAECYLQSGEAEAPAWPFRESVFYVFNCNQCANSMIQIRKRH